MLDINLLGLLRPDFAVVLCSSPLVFLLSAVVSLATLELGGVFALEPLDDVPEPELLASGFN